MSICSALVISNRTNSITIRGDHTTLIKNMYTEFGSTIVTPNKLTKSITIWFYNCFNSVGELVSVEFFWA